MKGWIILHRSVMDHWVWLSEKHFKRWIELIFLASWEDKTLDFGTKQIKIKRGQFATSYRQLQYNWNTSPSGVQSFLKMLQKSKMIKYRNNNNEMTIITILNYDKYQSEKFWEDKDEDYGQMETISENDSVTQNPSQVSDTPLNDMERNQEQTEINKRKEVNNNSLSLEEREKKFFEEVKASQIYMENVAKNHSLSIEDTLKKLEEFFGYISTVQHWHNDVADFRDHFYKWITRKLETAGKDGNRKQKNGGGQSTQDKYAARRGTDVGDKKSTDYGGSF